MKNILERTPPRQVREVLNIVNADFEVFNSRSEYTRSIVPRIKMDRQQENTEYKAETRTEVLEVLPGQ